MKKGIAFATLIAFSGAVYADGHSSTLDYPEIQRNIEKFDTDDTFHFNFDKDIILNGSVRAADERLSEIAEKMKVKPNMKVRIEGFADETGTSDYNYGLASRRIAAVVYVLVSKGVPKDAIVAVPYGELNEIAEGHSNEAWAANRRVRVRIISE